MDIKINYVGFWDTLDKQNNIFYNTLSKHFNVIISDNPDYLFVSCFGNYMDFFNYPNAIKIFYSGEDISPDFNFFDYCIGYNDFKCGDRYCQFPVYLHHEKLDKFNLKKLSYAEAKNALKSKSIFCNFIYREDRFDKKRSELFYKLNNYKRVESYGQFLNNQSEGKCVSYINIEEKFDVLKKSKFTIAVDSVDLDDFVTEKIHHAILCDTIPIYVGAKTVGKYFNKERFIDLNDFSSIDEMVEYVKKVDNDNDLFLKILTAEPLVNPNYIKERFEELENFLVNIVSQDLNKAIRRPITGKVIRGIGGELAQYYKMRKKLLVRIQRKFLK